MNVYRIIATLLKKKIQKLSISKLITAPPIQKKNHHLIVQIMKQNLSSTFPQISKNTFHDIKKKTPFDEKSMLLIGLPKICFK